MSRILLLAAAALIYGLVPTASYAAHKTHKAHPTPEADKTNDSEPKTPLEVPEWMGRSMEKILTGEGPLNDAPAKK